MIRIKNYNEVQLKLYSIIKNKHPCNDQQQTLQRFVHQVSEHFSGKPIPHRELAS